MIHSDSIQKGFYNKAGILEWKCGRFIFFHIPKKMSPFNNAKENACTCRNIKQENKLTCLRKNTGGTHK